MSNPTKISQPFAANGDKNTIPNTSTNDSIATQSLGFPPRTGLAIASGGVAPTRKDFNGILNLISQHSYFAQSGNLYEYDSTLDYTVNAIVTYNGQIYRCIQANGASSTVKSPTETAYWQPFYGKLYTTTGSNTDGAVTQAAVTTALAGKLGNTASDITTALGNTAVAVATKATQDGSGNNIASTYATKTELSSYCHAYSGNCDSVATSGGDEDWIIFTVTIPGSGDVYCNGYTQCKTNYNTTAYGSFSGVYTGGNSITVSSHQSDGVRYVSGTDKFVCTYIPLP